MVDLSLKEAQAIIKKAQEKANQLKVKVTVYIVDGSGYPVAFERMDGAGMITPDVARAKAFTAAALGTDVIEFMKPRDAMHLGALMNVSMGGSGLVFLNGGAAIKKGNAVVGGVGVSGATGEQDYECAKAGLTALA